MPDADHEDRPPGQKFSQWIAEHRLGRLDDELTAHLLEVADEVLLHGKSGSITLKLNLTESSGGLTVSSDVKTTRPKVSTAAFYYRDEAYGLTRNDPRQPQLPGIPEKDLY